MANDTVTLTIEGKTADDELTVPSELVDMLREDDQSDPEVVGDLVLMGMAQRTHGAVAHAEGEADRAMVELDELTMELFEDRFGASFAELTGHNH